MIPFVDIHTHRQAHVHGVISIYNCLIHEPGIPNIPFSAGLHPWYADRCEKKAVAEILEEIRYNPNLLAIGEIGLDFKSKIDETCLKELFLFQLEIAESYQLPVILHCVKAWEVLIDCTSGFKMPMILHGYNSSPELTKRLIDKGFLFSIGKALLKDDSKIARSVNAIPVESLFCETDDYQVTIEEIYLQLAIIKGVEVLTLKERIYANYLRIFG